MIVQMPDGTKVSFPDDMPKEQIKGLIASKFPDVAQPKAPEEKPHDVGSILNRMYELGPAESASRIGGGILEGARSLATGVVQSAKDAVTAPSRALSGELRMTDESGRTSPEAIAEGFNMATWANPASVAMGTGKQIARNAALEAAKRPPSEGAMVAQSARDIGVTLPRAVTSDRASVQQMGKVVANVPIAGQPLRNASKTAIEQLDAAAKKAQDDLGSGDRVLAGDRVRTGLQEFSKAMDTKIDDMEKGLSSTMQPDRLSPLHSTRRLASTIQKERTTNANTSRSRALAEVEEALSRPGMTFEGLRGLRTKIRNLRDVNPDQLTTNDFDKAELSRLYGALTDDLKLAAKNAGGDNALNEFNKVVAKEAEIAKDRESLQRVLGRNMSDEALSDKLFRMAGDKSTANIQDLAKVRMAVSKETWDELSSSVIARMGRDAEGQFTPERFTTSWGRLSDGGKNLLFDAETRKSVDAIASVSSRFKKLNEYANPSGTGMTTVGSSYLAGAFLDPMTTASALLGTYATAKMLAKPASAKALADYAKAYEVAVRMPGQTSQSALANKAKALALVAANGNEVGASNLAAKLATVQQTAADQEDGEQVRGPEGNPEANQASAELNELILQGRAF